MIATLVLCGAIRFSISSDLPTIEYSRKEKPVMLPPGWAMLGMMPCDTGSLTTENTMGIVVVACFRATVAGVPLPSRTSGASCTSCSA